MLRTDLKHPSLALAGWILASVFVVFQFFLQSATSVLGQYWLTDFSLSTIGLSLLSSAFFYAYLFMQIPVGVWFDHYHPEKLIALGSGLVALGCWLLASAPGLYLGLIARLLMGAGSAFGYIGLLKVTALVFQPRRFAFMLGLSETWTMLMITLGIILLAWVLKGTSWRMTMVVSGILAALVSITALILIKRQGKDVHAPPPHPLAWATVWINLKRVIKQRQLWLISLYSFFMFALVNVFSSLWGVAFLVHTQGLEHEQAANIMSMIFVGIGIGGPLLGFITHYRSRRQVLAVTALLAALLLLYLLMSQHLALSVLYVGYVFMGMFCAAYIVGFSVIKDNAPPVLQATSMAVSNIIIMASAPVLQTFVGALLQHAGGILVASAAAYRWAMLILPLGMFIACGLCVFIRDPQVDIHQVSVDAVDLS